MDKPRSRSPANRRRALPPLRIRPPGKSNGPVMNTAKGPTLDPHLVAKSPTTKAKGAPSVYTPITPKHVPEYAARSAPYRPRPNLTHTLLRSKTLFPPKLPVPPRPPTAPPLLPFGPRLLRPPRPPSDPPPHGTILFETKF